MSVNKIPHQIFKESELNNSQDYSPDNPINTNNSDEKISIIEEFQLDIQRPKRSCCINNEWKSL